MKKKVLLIATAAILLLSTAALASQSDFEQLARQYVPTDAVFERMERDDGLTEYQFRSPDHTIEYEVKINPKTQSVVKVDYDVHNDRGSKNVVLTEDQAKEKVLGLYPEAEVISVLLKHDDGLQEYLVVFNTPDFSGRIKINPETGDVLDRELDYTRTAVDGAQALSEEEARALVLSQVEDGWIVEFKTDRDDGRTVYEGEVISGKSEYEFEIDVETGVILKWERDD